MKTLLIVLATLAIGYSNSPDKNFGALDTRQYKDNVAKLNGFIACMLKVAPCQGLDAHIQARAIEIIDSACAVCNNDQKAVIHDLIALIAQKNPKILKGIFKRYDLKSQDGKRFIQVISKFPSKANITYTPVSSKSSTVASKIIV